MRKYLIWIAAILFLLACQGGTPIAYTPQSVPAILSTLETKPAAFDFLLPSATPPFFTSTPTLTIVPTFSPVPTLTITPTPTIELVRQGPDSVTVPILLYHHVEPPKDGSRYYIAPDKFEEQMKLLREWGYTTITLDLLLQAIHEGADLPARPIIITFDDGQTSVYTTAFPIMQKYGFTGVVYIVGTYLDAETFMTTGQVQELASAGWEVGSHGMTHKELTGMKPDDQKYEIIQSRKLLTKKLGVPVNSFAYPFGFTTESAFKYVRDAGYTSAVGVGYTHTQGMWNIYLLQRRDILGTYDLKKFASFLPWYGDAGFLPTDTPTMTPTVTRTPYATKKKP